MHYNLMTGRHMFILFLLILLDCDLCKTKKVINGYSESKKESA